MRIVLDTNVLIAGLLKDSIVRNILLYKDIKFFLPEEAIEEINKHKDELIEKSGYCLTEFEEILNFLLKKIILVSKEMIKLQLEKAEYIMKDIDIADSSFIATALSINADGIWSFDKHFIKQKVVKIFYIEDIIKMN